MTAHTPSKNPLLPWFMWLLGALFYCYEFLLQVSPNVLANEIMRDFSINASQLGNFGAFYLYAYAFMQILIGSLLDRFGSRRLLTIAALLCAAGAFLFGTAHIFAIATLGRLLIGVGSAFAAISCMHIAATWLPIRHFALMTGLLVTIGMLGAVFGQAPLAIIVSHMGWRTAMINFGFIGIGLSLIIWLVVRDNPNFQQEQLPFNKSLQALASNAWQIIRTKQIWSVSIYGGLMYLSIPALGGLWGVSFLIKFYQLSEATAAFIISFLFIGFAVGSPLFGVISDRIQRRKLPMIIGSIGTLITLICIIYTPGLSVTIVGCLLFALGFFCSGFLTIFSTAREISTSETTATALGFANMLNSLGGAFAQSLIGILLDVHWNKTMVNGTPVYSIADFHFALAALPIAVLISIFFLPVIKETFCKAQTAR